MFCNLTGKQLLLIILAIIIMLWFINWLMNRGKGVKLSPQQMAAAATAAAIRQQQQHMAAGQQMTAQQQMAAQQMLAQQQPGVLGFDDQSKQEAPFILYYFHDPNCGACKNFSPVWNEVASKLTGINNLSIRTIHSTKPENENLSFYYNITGTPTVILVTPDRNIEYTGNRTADDLYNFVINNLKEYAQNPQYQTAN